MYLSSQFIVVSSTSLIFIGYLCTCVPNVYVEAQSSSPKIWPNISDNHSFLQFPGLTGSGGLDFNLYDAVSRVVNKTRLLPSVLTGTDPSYKVLQIALMAAVGGLLTGAAAILAEAHFFRLYYSHLFEDDPVPAHYGPPLTLEYGAPSPPSTYGSPNPPSTYGSPNPPSTYGSPSPPSTYGSPNPPSTYGSPSPPSTYGSPNPPSTYGSPNPPSTYGSPSPPSTYGSPIPPSTYGEPSLSSEYGVPNPPTGYGVPSL